MIDDFISILVGSNRITSLASELHTCSNSLGGIFEADDSRFVLKKSFLSSDLDSSVNLVLAPDNLFENLFYVDDELADVWYVLNGLHHFQMGQLFRYSEATVFRFVTTIFTGSAVTGSVYITGDKYSELAEKYAKDQHKLDSWVNSKHWDRFQAAKK